MTLKTRMCGNRLKEHSAPEPRRNCWCFEFNAYLPETRFEGNCGSPICASRRATLLNRRLSQVPSDFFCPGSAEERAEFNPAVFQFAPGPSLLIRGGCAFAVRPIGLWRGRIMVDCNYGGGDRFAFRSVEHTASLRGRIANQKQPLVSTDVAFWRSDSVAARNWAHRLSRRNLFLSPALLRIRSFIVSGSSMPAPNRAAQEIGLGSFRIRFCPRRICLTSGHYGKRQTLLAKSSSIRRLDLWTLRKPQPLRRTDGNADSDSASFGFDRRADRPEQGAGAHCGCGHGQHNFSFWISRRHGSLRCANNPAGRFSVQTTKRPDSQLCIYRIPGSFTDIAAMARRKRLGRACGHRKHRCACRIVDSHPTHHRPRCTENLRTKATGRLGAGCLWRNLSQLQQSFH